MPYQDAPEPTQEEIDARPLVDNDTVAGERNHPEAGPEDSPTTGGDSVTVEQVGPGTEESDEDKGTV